MTDDRLLSLSPGRRRTIQRVIDADGYMGADHFAGVVYRVLGRGRRSMPLEAFRVVSSGRTLELSEGSRVVDARDFVAPAATGAVVIYDRKVPTGLPAEEWYKRYRAHTRPRRSKRDSPVATVGAILEPGPFSLERQLADAGLLDAHRSSLWSFASVVADNGKPREIVGVCQAISSEGASDQVARALTQATGGLSVLSVDLLDTQLRNVSVTWPAYERAIAGDLGDWLQLVGL